MEQKRLLLPFTCDVDVKALHSILQLAKIHNATLVALALIPLSAQQRPEEVRLESIEQVQDFLATLQTQADIHAVRVEAHELYTHDVLASICSYAHHLHCQQVLLSYEGERAHFLHAHEAQQLRLLNAHPLHVLYTQPKQRAKKGFLHTFVAQVAASC